MNGTLETLMMTPTPLTHVIMGRTLFNCLLGLLDALIVFLLAEVVLDASVTLVDPAAFFLALLLTLLSLSTVGLLFSGLFVFTRASSAVMQILEFPIYMLCGAILPVTALPEVLRPISCAIAPSWGVDALRVSAGLEVGNPMGWGFAADIMAMLAISVAYLALSVMVFRCLDRKARTVGALGRW
jgi:ABC-2 type transport system permease protein